jgi:integrase
MTTLSTIRLYTEDTDTDSFQPGGDLPQLARLTVRQYYDQQWLPAHRSALEPTTISTDRTSLSRWEKFGGAWCKRWQFNRWHKFEACYDLDRDQQRIWSSSPPIGMIADADLLEFVERLQQSGLSPASVDQTERTLSKIFAYAGPRERGNRGQDTLIVRPAFPKRDAVPWTAHRFLTVGEISQLYRGAARIDRISQRIPDRSISDLACALVVFLANYGLRPIDVCRLQWDRNICHNASVLRFCAKKTEKQKPAQVVMPVNHVTRLHLLKIRQSGRAEVFFRPNQLRLLRKLWHRIVEESGVEITTRSDAANKDYIEPSLKSMRRYCGDTLNGHCPQGSGSWVLGHAIPSISKVTARHYNRVFEVPDFVRKALFSVPQPAAFGSDSSPQHAGSPSTSTDLSKRA